MNITLPELGERLQMLRKALDLSQKDLAASLEVGQNQISRLENGIGGSLELLLQLLNFYGKNFLICFIFSEQFEVIKKTDDLPVSNTFNSIAVERLKLLQTDFAEQITDIISIMETTGQ